MPQLVYPAPLTPGDRIAVTAPSSGVQAPLHARLNLVLQHLRDQGFVVEEGQCLRQEMDSASAPAAQRAAELMALLLRPDVHAIFPPWGGELAIALLDLLDWPALQRARPKWLIGYSDTSTLLLAITRRLGWATAHGPCLMDLAPGQNDALTRQMMEHLATPAGGSFTQHASSHWQSQWTDFADVPACTYSLTEPTVWRCLNRPADAPVAFSGRLIGGCVDTLMHLAGTPYGDVAGFARQQPEHGTVLYLENAEQSPEAWMRALQGLRWHGWFNGLTGVLIGRSAAPDSTSEHRLRFEQALHLSLAHLPCPVLVGVDIGHRPPQLLLINGALAQVQWQPGGGNVTQTLV
jgi:muramoyltetrapeptide carboxypeptidase